ncbi:hypothetical protein AYO40_06365 [Planctomycetaceae bacterium SCGC AG-212-D15]|nr:hypothetical protein AYO40_06365 [Planctomycetaceae bacterium SCGC AG-212-D15]
MTPAPEELRDQDTPPAWKPEWVAACLVLVFGLGFVFLMPPCQTPDEHAHFLRSYHVSDGNPMPAMVGSCGGGDIPISILTVPVPFGNLPLRPNSHTRLATFAPLWSLPLSPEQRQTVRFPNSAYYSFVPYVPQALGIATARSLGAGALAVHYAGRLGNLLLAVVLVFWAIRLTPIFKLVFALVALMPMAVHQFACMSPDGSSFGVALLLTALFLRLAVARPAGGRAFELAGLFVVAGWMTLCKFPYGALTLLYLAIPAEHLGGRRRYLKLGFALMFLVAGLVVAQTQFRRFTSDGVPLPRSTASIAGQLDFIRHDPLGYLQVMGQTVAEHGKIWIDQLGMLGWLDTFVNPLAMHWLFTMLVLVALADRGPLGVPPLLLRLIALATAVLCVAVVLTAVYVCGIPVRAPLMNGMQGRYFLPVIPLLLMSLSNRRIVVRVRPDVLLALVTATGAGVLLIAQFAALRRYYHRPSAQLWMSPLGVAAGLGLGAAIFYVMTRRRPALREPGVALSSHVDFQAGEACMPTSVSS